MFFLIIPEWTYLYHKSTTKYYSLKNTTSQSNGFENSRTKFPVVRTRYTIINEKNELVIESALRKKIWDLLTDNCFQFTGFIWFSLRP
jgi:hypothetical protein